MPSRPSQKRDDAPQRPSHFRLQKKTLLIYCEGSETEYNYFEGLRKECHADLPYRLVVKRGSGQNAQAVVTAAKDESKRKVNRTPVYDDAVCVLDVEHAAHKPTLTQAIALARQHKIRLYLSSPSFEVWLLCHFGHVTKWLEDGDAAKRHLSETCWQQRFRRPYKENDPEIYSGLAKDVSAAVDNARWLLAQKDDPRSFCDARPSTEVHLLIERLLSEQPAPG